jgi:hypothetical protein
MDVPATAPSSGRAPCVGPQDKHGPQDRYQGDQEECGQPYPGHLHQPPSPEHPNRVCLTRVTDCRKASLGSARVSPIPEW